LQAHYYLIYALPICTEGHNEWEIQYKFHHIKNKMIYVYYNECYLTL